MKWHACMVCAAPSQSVGWYTCMHVYRLTSGDLCRHPQARSLTLQLTQAHSLTQ